MSAEGSTTVTYSDGRQDRKSATLNHLTEYQRILKMQEAEKQEAPDFWDKNFRDSVKKGELS